MDEGCGSGLAYEIAIAILVVVNLQYLGGGGIAVWLICERALRGCSLLTLLQPLRGGRQH